MCSSAKRRKGRVRSWRGYDHLITAGEATVTWTIPGTRPHYTTGGVRAGFPEGSQPPQSRSSSHRERHPSKSPRCHHSRSWNGEHRSHSKSPDHYHSTDTGATWRLLKDLRNASGRAGEGMNYGFSVILVLMASCVHEGICRCERIKIYSPGSYENNLGFWFCLFFSPKIFSTLFFFFKSKRWWVLYLFLNYNPQFEG